ncbi:hypothetical protein EDD21DRAFT_351001 [Dissophora ornata]|nr:hypothetical protein EDD21DRAFT_351001 [Dissophora ornata]
MSPSRPSVLWISDMVSSPQRPGSSLSLHPSMQDGSFFPPHELVEARAWKSLTHIELDSVRLQPKDWRGMIEAIDFSALELLSFENSSFGLEELKMLVDRISDDGDFELPLVTLGLQGTSVAWDSEMADVCEQFRRLKTMVPFVEIQCI